jgi:low temperature requirement protein LtrA
VSITDGHYRHGLRRMFARRTTERGRTATPLELLFDLTFVAAFGVAGEQLAHGIAIGEWMLATGGFVFAMFTIVWAWINVTWFGSAFDNDDWLYRLLTMVQMAGVIVLAIGLPPLFASIEEGVVLDNRVMVAGYVVMRVALLLQWIRAVKTDSRYRTTALTYVLFIGVAQLGWILLAVFPTKPATALLIVIVLLGVEVLGPVIAERRGARKSDGATPWHPHHLAERFALLTIIALGETVFGTLASAREIADAEGWAFDSVLTVGTGVALSFALWWTYFLVPHALALEARRDRTIVWAYLHVFLFTALAAVGAGLHLIGYAADPHYELSATAVVAATAIPVAAFMLIRYALQFWLVSAAPPLTLVQLLAIALPILAIVLAALGLPVWLCHLLVLLAPASIILTYELGAWRTLDLQLNALPLPNSPASSVE